MVEGKKNLLNIIFKMKMLSKKKQEISIKTCLKKKKKQKKNMEKIGIKNGKNELLLVSQRKNIEKCMG